MAFTYRELEHHEVARPAAAFARRLRRPREGERGGAERETPEAVVARAIQQLAELHLSRADWAAAVLLSLLNWLGAGVAAAPAAVAVMIYRLISLWLVLLLGWVLYAVLRHRRARQARALH